MPIDDQLPPPAGETSKAACWTPEPPSAESEETATELPCTQAAPGAVTDPVGAVPSYVMVVVEKLWTFPAVSTARAWTT